MNCDDTMNAVKCAGGIITFAVGAPILVFGGPFINFGVGIACLGFCYPTAPIIAGVEYIVSDNMHFTEEYVDVLANMGDRLTLVNLEMRRRMLKLIK